MNDEAFMNAIFDVALEDGKIDIDIKTRTSVLWTVGIILLADVLLRKDELNRERLLRGLDRELRDALVGIPKCMHGLKQ
jgi:hypothetical protein